MNDVTECSGRFPDAGEVNLQDSWVCLNPTKACAWQLGRDVSWKICFEGDAPPSGERVWIVARRKLVRGLLGAGLRPSSAD